MAGPGAGRGQVGLEWRVHMSGRRGIGNRLGRKVQGEWGLAWLVVRRLGRGRHRHGWREVCWHILHQGATGASASCRRAAGSAARWCGIYLDICLFDRLMGQVGAVSSAAGQFSGCPTSALALGVNFRWTEMQPFCLPLTIITGACNRSSPLFLTYSGGRGRG